MQDHSPGLEGVWWERRGRENVGRTWLLGDLLSRQLSSCQCLVRAEGHLNLTPESKRKLSV